MLAPSTFIVSAAGCASLARAILPNRLDDHNKPIYMDAVTAWRSALVTPVEPPTGIDATRQRCWDFPIMEGYFKVTSVLLLTLEEEPDCWKLSRRSQELGSDQSQFLVSKWETRASESLLVFISVPAFVFHTLVPVGAYIWTTLEFTDLVAETVREEYLITPH